ncbi:MAG: carbon-nitrogen hydrolase family protein [Pseudomonadota bacterium]|nr:carbon-nitrogen hydrolase family protein [Pseudomonadota bacterium]|tara:strand:- start:342 stop:1160 length:819 start_codon:yes stop_codon:yes gene_type:complete
MSKVSAIQLNSGPNIKVNLYDVKSYIEQIADTDSKMVVLPENFALMPENDEDYLKHSESLGDGPIQNYISELAGTYKIWIVSGTIPIKSSDKDRVMASTLTFNHKGERVSLYNKIHLFDVTLPKSKDSYNESKYFMPGNHIEVIDTPIGRAGIACCYDLRFPELFRSQHEKEIEVIILPASFTEQTGKVHWDTLVKARAIENLSYVVTSCQGGYHINGKKTYGHTMIVSPWGKTLDSIDKGKGFISSEIDLIQLKSIRQNFPVLDHMKLVKK